MVSEVSLMDGIAEKHTRSFSRGELIGFEVLVSEKATSLEEALKINADLVAKRLILEEGVIGIEAEITLVGADCVARDFYKNTEVEV